MPKETLGERLKLLRISNAYEQKEIADLLGVNRITVYLWESDKSKPTMKYRRKLADLYNVSKKRLIVKEIKKMKITKITIESFRNLHDLVIEPSNQTFIKGNNMQGKTNVLNAIMWCLTDVDLSGSNNNDLNIPFGEDKASVEITIGETVIKRTAIKSEKETTEIIYINGVETPTKQAENIILKAFGLLEQSLKDTKSFKIIRFLLNPNYFRTVAPKSLREYVVSIIAKDIDEKAIVENSDCQTKQRKQLYQAFLHLEILLLILLVLIVKLSQIREDWKSTK